MTREEQIRKASYSADNNVHANPHPVPGVDKMFNDYFSMCFKLGAEWADSHPHWIPVEEELPKETGWYLVATPTLNSKIDVAFWDGKWRRLVTITHWMEIVPPRKEG